MEDSSKQQQSPSFGSGGQRNSHSRPFFYVQPPSQPHYLYQHMPMSNPYAHLGMPAGLNLGRPCMPPYPYMPYPGFVLPHAPIYPMDYRRMFEPRFPCPMWADAPPRPQQYPHPYAHPQPQRRRDTTCSEAQTDPSDAIATLIQCLDKLRSSELDSGVASQSFSGFSPEERGPPMQPDPRRREVQLQTLGEPSVAAAGGRVVLEGQGGWSEVREEDLPIDCSSVHEDCAEQTPRFLSGREEEEEVTERVTDVRPNVSVANSEDPSASTQTHKSLSSSPSSSSGAPALRETKSSEALSEADRPAASADDEDAAGCQILRLPFDGASASHFLSSTPPPPPPPYYYNYLSAPGGTHERMSVLSPSLDELSSRDEMFSTDLDEADIFPKRVYRAGRRPLGVEAGAAEGDAGRRKAAQQCACCGKSLSRGKSAGSKVFWGDARDSDEEEEEEETRFVRSSKQPVRVVVRKHEPPRKPHPLPQRHQVKSWYRKSSYREEEEDGECDAHQQGAAEGESPERDSGEQQCRTCQDDHSRDVGTATTERGKWGDGVILRRRQTGLLQRQVKGEPRC